MVNMMELWKEEPDKAAFMCAIYELSVERAEPDQDPTTISLDMRAILNRADAWRGLQEDAARRRLEDIIARGRRLPRESIRRAT